MSMAEAAPPLATRSLDRCLSCGGTKLDALPLRYEYRGSFPAVQCATCGLRFLSVQPTADALTELYSSAYFESDFRCGRSDVSYFSEPAFIEEDRGLLDDFAKLGLAGRMLEIGCAGGWLLKHARARGWQVQGVELSADAVAHARSLGLEVFHGDLASAALPQATFDLVYMGDVLEHVPDCRATLLEVARVLKPGGALYLRGPITTHSIARSLALSVCRLAGRTIVLREPPYHLWEFTPAPLARLFESCGLDVAVSRQSKIAPGHAHGKKSTLERAAMGVLDTLNVPITAMFNARGDRIVMVGKRKA